MTISGVEKEEPAHQSHISENNSYHEDHSNIFGEKEIVKPNKFSFGIVEENENMNADKPTNHNSRQSPNHQSQNQLKDENDNENDEYIIDCEPSMEEDDGYASPQFLELNSQNNNQVDNIELMVTKGNEVSPNNEKLKSKLLELQESSAKKENRILRSIKKEATPEKDLNSSCNIRAQTGDEDHSKFIKMQDLVQQAGLYHPLNEEEGLTARNGGLAKIPSEKIAQMHDSYIVKKALETSCVNIYP